MPRVVVRKGYRCLPGKRRELLAALQRVDAIAAEAGWPRGRYLFVETKAPGEPDLEVEFTFESYAEMEHLERRLREHLARVPKDSIGSAGQEFLLEPSATRFLLVLDESAPANRRSEPPARSAARPSAPATSAPAASAPARATQAPPEAIEEASPEPELPAESEGPAEVLSPAVLSPAELRARQLARARAVLDHAEATANVSPERRASERKIIPLPQRREERDEER
ncbi:MAG: hypothetical protein HY332_00215 [Chloroflexi bacterium]|nr:hypothetical protein [Chloroflexota bacterium]